MSERVPYLYQHVNKPIRRTLLYNLRLRLKTTQGWNVFRHEETHVNVCDLNDLKLNTYTPIGPIPGPPPPCGIENVLCRFK
jgi:hypothetical protein